MMVERNDRRDHRRSFRNDRDNRNRNAPEVVESPWVPKTALGRDVLAKKYSSLDSVIASGKRIQEEQITEFLMPNIQTEFVNVGQAKGKFGGGKRKISKPTQKKTREGNKMSFSMIVVSGNNEGVVGSWYRKSKRNCSCKRKSCKGSKARSYYD